ncbi:MAG: CapA family protein [Lachnospiraceae bacterium]|nr:CapA family protein [Lachnospiraceae bacterium]
MDQLVFYGDVHWEGKGSFPESNAPYVFNMEYAAETVGAAPASNKIIVTGSGDFSSWKTKPLAVNLANNHIMDLGDQGFLHTLSLLEQQQIAYFGAGKRDDNYHNPCFIFLAGRKIAFLGYCDYDFLLGKSPAEHGCAVPSREQIQKDVKICRGGVEPADIVIVNIHWGREERSWHNKRQEQTGHWLIDAGADLVIGHHPHCIQPVEIYRGKYIFYSLGNTYFPDLRAPSYYDENGTSEFTASVRNLKCGRNSLRVTYDIPQKQVTEICRMRYQKGKTREGRPVSNIHAICRKYKNPLINETAGYLRRLLILIKSNLFVDGRLINGKAFRKEFEFLAAKKKRERR